MNVLITGSSGQVGHEWVSYARSRGWEVLAPTSTELDLMQLEKLEAYLETYRPEQVINCAAWTDVDGAESSPEQAFRINRDAVERIAQWTGKHRVPLIHYSTDYVFPGRASDRERYPSGYPEDAQTGPINIYGESKRAGEMAVLAQDPHALILRLSWVCGRHGSNFLKTMLRLAAERDHLQVVDDQIGSPTWAHTVPSVSAALVDRSKRGIFHLSQSGRATWYELACELFRVAGVTIRVEPVSSDAFPRPAPRPRFSRLNLNKVTGAIGKQPTGWREELPKLVDQLRSR
ncbi:MAG: dTDP-4-dehydrorhamnose reductase [Balneolaceae bacterium]